MAHENSALLVTGASGHLGRRVAELLLASEAARERGLIVTTRTPDAVADLAARGAMVRRADFEDEASLEAAFRGVQRALIVSTDALDRPGRGIAQHRAAVAAARAAGARHLLYTSLTNPGPESRVTIAPDHDATERAIWAAGLGYTILRNNLYTEYLLPGPVRALQTGALRNSYGAGAVVTSSAVQDLTGAAPASVRAFLLAQRAVLAA